MATNKDNTNTSLFSRATHSVYVIEDKGNSTGNRFFVDSGKATTGGDTQGFGSNPDKPFLTLDYAVASASGHLTADNGDIIYVMPGHTESCVSAGDITMDVAGVTVIGLGDIGSRPVITFDTADTADLEIDAANITIKNISFRCDIADLAAAIDVDAAHFHIKDCSFVGTDAADEAFLITIITDAAANDMIVESCDFNYMYAEDATAITTVSTECIRLVGADRAIIKDCYISGDFTTSAINSVTTESLGVQVLGNRIQNTATENISGAIDMDSNTTGFIGDENEMYAADPTSPNDVMDDGACVVGVNWVVNDIGEAPILWGTADSESIAGKIDVIDAYHDVPAADSDSNAQMNEVLGNKTDALSTGAVGTTRSVIRYLKQLVTELQVVDGIVDTIDLYHDIPATDSASNVQMNEVLGSKADTLSTGAVGTTRSVIRYLKQLVTELQVVDGIVDTIDLYHDIPATDSASNVQMNEVLGSKADTLSTGAVGTTRSVIRYLKQLVTELQVVDGIVDTIDLYHDIPATDSASNVQMNEVIGSKADTLSTGAVGTTRSAIRYLKQLVTELQVVDLYHDIPATDSASNAQMNEVLGSKADTLSTGAVGTTRSVIRYLKQLVTELQVVDGIVDTIDIYHDIPATDSASNVQMNEVLGSKADTLSTGAVGTTRSVIRYLKQLVTELQVVDGIVDTIDLYHDVPGADSSSNAQMNEVIGIKTDTANTGVVGTTQSAMRYLKQLVSTADAVHSDAANYLSVTADFSSATWNSVAAHEIAAVTGVARVRILPHVGASIGNDDNNCKISLGTSSSTAGFIAATTATFLDTGEIWWGVTGASATAIMDYANIIDYIVDGDDIGYTLATTAATAGSMVFDIWWEPISDGAAVTAGAGGVF